MREQVEEIENLRFKCSKADQLQERIEAQEAEISTLIARLNRELRFSTANQDAVDADDQRMTQLSNRLRVQEAELANLNTVEAQYKSQIDKTREAKDELYKMRSELSQAEVGQRNAETKVCARLCLPVPHCGPRSLCLTVCPPSILLNLSMKQVRMLEVQLSETNSKIDTLQVSRQTLHQSQADTTGLREECSRATAALSRCQADRDKLEEEIKMMRKNSEMSSKQVCRLSVLTVLITLTTLIAVRALAVLTTLTALIALAVLTTLYSLHCYTHHTHCTHCTAYTHCTACTHRTHIRSNGCKCSKAFMTKTKFTSKLKRPRTTDCRTWRNN